MEIAVIILNWHAAEDTIRCVQQFDGWQTVGAQIWVVDNASRDGSVAQITQACPHVAVIENASNLGFAGASNRGIVAALAQGDRPILLLNNDARLDETTAKQLIRSLDDDPNLALVGPLLYSTDATPRLIAAGSTNPVWSIDNLNRTIPDDASVFDVNYISGSVALACPQALRQVGLLDEDYFFYTEIADWCRRARRQGYRIGVDARVRASHDLDRSSALRNTLYVYYLMRNRFLYIQKAYPGVGGLFPRLLLKGFWTAYGLLLALQLRLKGNRGRALAVWLGVSDGLRGVTGGQNERVLHMCGGSVPGATDA
jgi:GT2 family glycosyltransferase